MRWREVLGTPAVQRVAPCLLGARLVSTLGADPVLLRITEVEAYAGVGQDPGSHAHRGPTDRNRAMFGPPGHAYVYLIYGLHHCLNIVTGPPGSASAVLLRAAAVEDGHDTARRRAGAGARPVPDRDLARGPGRLARALGIDRGTAVDVDGVDLLDPDGPLHLLGEPPAAAPAHATSTRTGVRGPGAPTPWRFWLPGEPTVSPHRPLPADTGHLRP